MKSIYLVAFFVFLGVSSHVDAGRIVGIPKSERNPERDLQSLRILNTLLKNRNDLLDEFIKGIITSLKESIPEVITIGDLEPITIIEGLIALNVNLTGLQITGQKDFNNTDVRTIIEGLLPPHGTAEVDIHFQTPLIISGHYEMDGNIAIILPLYGSGDFSLEIHDFFIMVAGGLRIPLNGDPPLFSNANYEISSLELVTKFEGLLGGGELGDELSAIIASVGLRLFHAIEPTIKPDLLVVITDLINQILAGTPTDFGVEAGMGISMGDIESMRKMGFLH